MPYQRVLRGLGRPELRSNLAGRVFQAGQLGLEGQDHQEGQGRLQLIKNTREIVFNSIQMENPK